MSKCYLKEKIIYFVFGWLAFCKYEELFLQYNDDNNNNNNNNNNIKDDNNITTNNAYIYIYVYTYVCIHVCMYNKIIIIIWNTEFWQEHHSYKVLAWKILVPPSNQISKSEKKVYMEKKREEKPW